MELHFNESLAENYHSNTQIARILTESWIEEYMFCPHCGNPHIVHFPNNQPVADFYCQSCRHEYELKSKKGKLGRKINDGAYETMIQRITSNQNPDFFFMSYSRESMEVTDLILIPNHFFVPEIIEKRKPLAATARRAGWTGCSILIEKIPVQGRISIIENGSIKEKEAVIRKISQGNLLRTNDLNARGWLMEILNCVNQIPTREFSLSQMYAYEPALKIKFPQNHNIQAKIRQQLQKLRDCGYIEFLGNGRYRKSNL